jgi:predicted DCC family thiol-disulfide oxidoreductase YuxK
VTLLVVYDADCAFCRACRAWVEARTPRAAVQFLACGSTDIVDVGACGRALHAVRATDGRTWSAHEAVVEVLRRVPRWRVLCPALTRSPLRFALAAGYRLVAGTRRCHGHA